MKKSTFLIYFLLFIALGIITAKLNPMKEEFNGISTLNVNTNLNYKISENDYKQKKKHKFIKSKVINHEILSEYKTKIDDEIVTKKIYKIRKNNKCGLLDDNEQVLTKIIYDDFLNFDTEKGIYLSILNNKKGLMNFKGKILIPAQFEEIQKTDFPNLVLVKKHKYIGLYDIKLAKEIIKPIYTGINSFDENNWEIESYVKKGIVNYNKNGKITTIKPKYNEIQYDTLFLTTKSSNKLGLIDTNSGEIISDTRYDEIELLNREQDCVKKILIFKTKIDNRYGIIFFSQKESTVIAPIYDKVKFKNGYVEVLSNNYWRTLDNKGDVTIRTFNAK